MILPTPQDAQFLQGILDNPPPPNTRLKEIMSYRQDDQQPPKDTREPKPTDDKYPRD